MLALRRLLRVHVERERLGVGGWEVAARRLELHEEAFVLLVKVGNGPEPVGFRGARLERVALLRSAARLVVVSLAESLVPAREGHLVLGMLLREGVDAVLALPRRELERLLLLALEPHPRRFRRLLRFEAHLEPVLALHLHRRLELLLEQALLLEAVVHREGLRARLDLGAAERDALRAHSLRLLLALREGSRLGRDGVGGEAHFPELLLRVRLEREVLLEADLHDGLGAQALAAVKVERLELDGAAVKAVGTRLPVPVPRPFAEEVRAVAVEGVEPLARDASSPPSSSARALLVTPHGALRLLRARQSSAARHVRHLRVGIVGGGKQLLLRSHRRRSRSWSRSRGRRPRHILH
mmetsp:Transcript_8457/g.28042  ORF Transcript_8457/g.28042 Transcript_8457/m.28042 type:complete len:354 (-) Transcript_8457:914-1975(-)